MLRTALTLSLILTSSIGVGATVGTRVSRPLSKFSFDPKVDVLIVIDNSASMEIMQRNAAAKIDSLKETLDRRMWLNYRISVVTSSMGVPVTAGCSGDNGRLVGCPAVVSSETPGGLQILKLNLVPGTSGSGTEQFFGPIIAALSSPLVEGENAGFYRQDATLATIVMTDSDDQSAVSAIQFVSFIENLKGGDLRKYLSYGIFDSPNAKACSSGEPAAVKLSEFFSRTGAKTADLCSADLSASFAGIAKNIVEMTAGLLILPESADPSTIRLTFGSQVIPNRPGTGWVYDPVRNAVLIGEDLVLQSEPPGTTLEVQYEAAEY